MVRDRGHARGVQTSSSAQVRSTRGICLSGATATPATSLRRATCRRQCRVRASHPAATVCGIAPSPRKKLARPGIRVRRLPDPARLPRERPHHPLRVRRPGDLRRAPIRAANADHLALATPAAGRRLRRLPGGGGITAFWAVNDSTRLRRPAQLQPVGADHVHVGPRLVGQLQNPVQVVEVLRS